MKKNYITPKINVVQFEALCSGGLVTCSVHRESLDKECISNFDVLNEEKTKNDTEYKDLWGESNSGKWGDD
mgnify:FL=1